MADHEQLKKESITEKINGKNHSPAIHKVLNGGSTSSWDVVNIAVDLALWKDKKATAVVFCGVTIVWALFEVFEYHFITLVCNLLLLTLAVLFFWSSASASINKTQPHIPEFHIPRRPVVEFVSLMINEYNEGAAFLRDIVLERDLTKLLAVMAGLWVSSICGSCYSYLTSCYIGFVFLFTVPVFYEKYKDHIDRYSERVMAEIKKLCEVLDKKVLSKIPRGALDKKNA